MTNGLILKQKILDYMTMRKNRGDPEITQYDLDLWSDRGELTSSVFAKLNREIGLKSPANQTVPEELRKSKSKSLTGADLEALRNMQNHQTFESEDVQKGLINFQAARKDPKQNMIFGKPSAPSIGGTKTAKPIGAVKPAAGGVVSAKPTTIGGNVGGSNIRSIAQAIKTKLGKSDASLEDVEKALISFQGARKDPKERKIFSKPSASSIGGMKTARSTSATAPKGGLSTATPKAAGTVSPGPSPVIKSDANIRKASEEAQDYISRKIRKLRHEGYKQDQAVAIAHSYARKEGYRVAKTDNESSLLDDRRVEFLHGPRAGVTEEVLIRGFTSRVPVNHYGAVNYRMHKIEAIDTGANTAQVYRVSGPVVSLDIPAPIRSTTPFEAKANMNDVLQRIDNEIQKTGAVDPTMKTEIKKEDPKHLKSIKGPEFFNRNQVKKYDGYSDIPVEDEQLAGLPKKEKAEMKTPFKNLKGRAAERILSIPTSDEQLAGKSKKAVKKSDMEATVGDDRPLPRDCPACNGPGSGEHLGTLGSLEHFRCRGCGMTFHAGHEKALEMPVKKAEKPEDLSKFDILNIMLSMQQSREDPQFINRSSITKFEATGEIDDVVRAAVYRRAGFKAQSSDLLSKVEKSYYPDLTTPKAEELRPIEKKTGCGFAKSDHLMGQCPSAVIVKARKAFTDHGVRDASVRDLFKAKKRGEYVFDDENDLKHHLENKNMAIISAYRKENSPEENVRRHDKFLSTIRQRGIPHTMATGVFHDDGGELIHEPSIVLHDINPTEADYLAQQNKQWGHIHVMGGKNHLIYHEPSVERRPETSGYRVDNNLPHDYTEVPLKSGKRARFQLSLNWRGKKD